MSAHALSDANDYSEGIPCEWSVNGHIDASRFLLLFDHATDAFRERLGIGRSYGESSSRAVFVAEAHLTYAKEVRSGDAVRIRTRLLGAAPRKVHVFHEMRRNGDVDVAATAEMLLVHVDRLNGLALALSADILERMQAIVALHAAQPLPVQVGRAIRMGASAMADSHR